MKIRIPLSLYRIQTYAIQFDEMRPLRRYFFLNIARERIHFCHWGHAFTVRFGIGYA